MNYSVATIPDDLGCLSCKCTFATGCRLEQRDNTRQGRPFAETVEKSASVPPSQRTQAQQSRYSNRHDTMAAVRAARQHAK